MGRVLVLTDRSSHETLPSLDALGRDVKTEPLSVESLHHVAELAPTVLIVDAEEAPEIAHGILAGLAGTSHVVPVAVVAARADVERFAWSEVADELLFSSMPQGELAARLAMLIRRTGGTGEAILRLGPLSLNTESYQVLVAGRVLDLTYKEFELLRFLLQSPERVFTRSELLQKVWGYNFYGGTRTVDVHVRRLRAKLGPEHEHLIATVRGVGYAASYRVQPES